MVASNTAGGLKTFRSLATLRLLNIVAVAASLAGGTGVVLGRMFRRWADEGPAQPSWAFSGSHALLTAATTFAFGLCWAVLLRSRAATQGGLGRGSLQAIALALANSATACGLLRVLEDGSFGRFLVGALAGATLGAIVWIPGLIATLICFGLPIAWSRRLAQKGLAGEERGELILGIVSALVAAAAIALLVYVLAPSDALLLTEQLLDQIGYLTVLGLSLVGVMAGGVAATFAYWRDRARRSFVREVEAGAVEGFRVDATDEGKVLMRITSLGQGYRVADLEEPIVWLEESGRVQQTVTIEPGRTRGAIR